MPRARPDGEVRRVHGVAHEDDVVGRPVGAADGREAPPDAPVPDQLVAVELLARRASSQYATDSSSVASSIPAARHVSSRALDDEGRTPRLVLVRVHAPQPVLVLAEVEGEGGERLRRAQPDEAVRAPVERSARSGPPTARAPASSRRRKRARGPTRTDPRWTVFPSSTRGVSPPPSTNPVNSVSKRIVDAERRRLLLQDRQERLAAHAAEAVPRRPHDLTAVVDVDVVPVHEGVGDRRVRDGIGVLDLGDRLVR